MSSAATLSVPSTWTDVCALAQIAPNTGVCALVGNEQVAIFRVWTASGEQLYALGNWDPIGQAMVLSRGLIGDKAGIPFIASPLYKQRFDLRTGACLDDPAVSVPVYAAREHHGRVEVGSAD